MNAFPHTPSTEPTVHLPKPLTTGTVHGEAAITAQLAASARLTAMAFAVTAAATLATIGATLSMGT